MNSTKSATDGFSAAFERSIRSIRIALRDLYDSVGADPRKPQVVSRAYGINRNLSWKIGKIILAQDPVTAFGHLPAQGSFKLLIEAFGEAGAPKQVREGLREALAEFEKLVALHAGDRSTLEILVENLDIAGPASPGSEATRRLAFLGSSGIWGVQARLRLVTQVLAPSRGDYKHIDCAMIGGVFDFRRLRPGVAWPLGRRILKVPRSDAARMKVEAIDPEESQAQGLPLMREFCSRPLPNLRTLRDGDSTITELEEGPVGNTGVLSCVFGWVVRQYAPIGPHPPGTHMEHVLRLDTPVETAFLDLLVHPDLPFPSEPELCLVSALNGPPRYPLSKSRLYHLPTGGRVRSLGAQPPNLDTVHLAEYPPMVERACAALDRGLDEFRAYRFEMNYPPVPSMAALYHRL